MQQAFEALTRVRAVKSVEKRCADVACWLRVAANGTHTWTGHDSLTDFVTRGNHDDIDDSGPQIATSTAGGWTTKQCIRSQQCFPSLQCSGMAGARLQRYFWMQTVERHRYAESRLDDRGGNDDCSCLRGSERCDQHRSGQCHSDPRGSGYPEHTRRTDTSWSVTGILRRTQGSDRKRHWYWM